MYVIVNGKEITFQKGDRMIDILPEEDKRKYYIVETPTSFKELNHKLYEKYNGRELTFHTLDHIEAGKAYEATLRFIIAKAFYELNPDVNIKFSYNVSRSIYMEVLNPDIKLNHYTDKLISKVKEIINKDLVIEKLTMKVSDALKIYDKFNYQDKIQIKTLKEDQTVVLYKCEDYYNFLYANMLPSTGYISEYVLKPYSPGLIIQYPRYEIGAKIPKFIEESTYGRTLRLAQNWGKLTKTNYISGINSKVTKENVRDFIQTCEAKHTNMLAELGEKIKEEQDTIRLICIAGPSSSGKTTFCNRLRIELMSRGITPVMISMDDYYLPKAEICKIQNTTIDKLDLEHINCLDIELFNQNLIDLINGDEVTLPKYNFKTGKRENGNTLKIDEHSPIMIEGIHALNELLTRSIPKHQKYKIYIAPQMQINIDNHTPLSTTDLRLTRRLVRDMFFRNCPGKDTIKMWPSVRRGEFNWIYPNQEGANYVFNSELTYELCVLKKYAIPELKKIKPEEKEYIVAQRIIKYLQYFDSIDDESSIPCNSIIREFIGGSCFDV